MAVVSNAMMTNMVNNSRGRNFRSYPILIATNPMSARVFMSEAMQRESRAGCPVIRAPKKQPPSLPAIAMNDTRAQPTQASDEFSDPTSVRRPVLVKKIGTSATRTKS